MHNTFCKCHTNATQSLKKSGILDWPETPSVEGNIMPWLIVSASQVELKAACNSVSIFCTVRWLPIWLLQMLATEICHRYCRFRYKHQQRNLHKDTQKWKCGKDELQVYPAINYEPCENKRRQFNSSQSGKRSNRFIRMRQSLHPRRSLIISLDGKLEIVCHKCFLAFKL